jgi:hypothetical protein
MRCKVIKTLCLSVLINPVYANFPSFVGDLVARDLDYVTTGWIGHTGLATAPHYKMRPTLVLEAMSTVPHIREGYINDFKAKSKFWGSRGGLLIPNYDLFTVANRVVEQYYACPAYSYTWQWKSGTISGTIPLTCALFRCDTLINYAYEFGQYHLPTYNTTWTTPLGVYNSFPIDTDLLIPERYLEPLSTEYSINETIDSINEDSIKTINSTNLYQMLQNTQQITKEQITNLWNLISSNDVDDSLKILFYNFMIFENPEYLIEDIINQSKKEKGETRNRLLLVIQSIYQEKLSKKDDSGLDPIINYFNELQNESLNKEDSGIIYRALAVLSPNKINNNKKNLINMDKIHIDIFRINHDHNNESKYVKDIIENLDHPDDRLLVTATYKYLTELLINSDLKLFSEDSKTLFKKHLADKKMIDYNQSMIYTSAFVEFKAALNAKNKEEIPELSNSYIKSLDNDTKKIVPFGFSSFTQNKLNIK